MPGEAPLEPIIVRPATGADAATVRAIDAVTWSPVHNPGGPPDPDADPLTPRPGRAASVVLVATRDGAGAIGYLRLETPYAILSGAHVRQINGLAVDPSAQRQGVARALLQGAVQLAREEGARKLSLRVFAGNAPARALYAAAGFEIEGVLQREFLVEGEWVDDVLMALWLD
jgi:RimJ/RimL family protein N-acetyltransferase